MQEWIKSLSGPSPQGSIAYDAPSQATPALPGRALGGPVQAGQSYIVGEQGPEVMTPQTSGQITPNAQTEAASAASKSSWNHFVPALGLGQAGMSPMLTPQAFAAKAASTPATASPSGAVPTANPALAPATDTTGHANTPGNAVMSAIMSYFNNPGEMSPVTYERAQEQANIGEASAKNAATTGLTGRGIDPNSPMGAALASAASLGAGRQRNEAARDYSLAQEGLRRQDIQAGMANYFNVLNTIFGLAGQQTGGAATNLNSVQGQPQPYGAIASGLSDLGNSVGKMK